MEEASGSSQPDPEVKKPETSADWAARKTASATIWIAAFTVILALVSLFTLFEVIEGGADTHTLAEAAKKQAEVASFALCETQRNNVIQQRLSDANRVSAEDSSADSLRATIGDSNLDQRAWIGVETIEGVPELKKQFIVTITIKNTGKIRIRGKLLLNA